MAGPWEKYGGVQIVPNRPGSEYQAPQAGATLRNTGANTVRTQVQTQGDVIDNQVKAATQAAAIAKARADAQAAQVEAATRSRQAAFAKAHNGLSQEAWNEAQSGLDQMHALNQTVANLRGQYNKNFKGKGIGSILEYLPATLRPANGVFDNTANSLLADMAKAKGLTSQQFNTPAEQKMFFQPLVPSSGDTDEQIASKIDALQRMVNQGTSRYARQLGMGIKGQPNQPKSPNVVDYNDLP